MSPASTEDKIRELYDEVSDAVDSKLLADATSRNALYKIHVALGKIVNNLNENGSAGRRSVSRSVSVVPEDKIVVEDITTVDNTTLDATALPEEADGRSDIYDDADSNDVTARPQATTEGDSIASEMMTDEE